MRNSSAPEMLGALVARIRGLVDAARLFNTGQNLGEHATATQLLRQSLAILDELRDVRSQEHALDASVVACIDRTLGLSLPDVMNNPASANHTLTVLGAFASELEYHLHDHGAVWASIVERAFLHLNRTLVVDDDTRLKWTNAFNTPRAGETECERLGGVHLLSHGIWGFKAHTKEERTDLVLQEPILEITTRDKRAVEALVLTEWKRVKPGEDVADKWREAKTQAKVYGCSSMAGFELSSVRYLVTVGMDHEVEQADVEEGGVVYRHVHVAIQRKSPSTISRS